MATRKTRPDPFDDVRDAFADLGTSEKAAFVLEATFETIGQALAETGRRAAAVLDDLDIDDWFRASDPDMPAPADVGAPPAPPPAPKAPTRKPPARKTTKPAAKKPTPKKTAGKPPKPPTDDA